TTPSSSSGSFGAAPPPAVSQFTVTPGTVSFPDTAIGTTSSITAVATLTSSGNAVQLTAITSSNPSEFPLTTAFRVPVAFAPAAPCLVSIQFKPSSAGTRSAQITMNTTSGSSGSLAVSGAGVPTTLSQIAISPDSFLFPNTVVGITSFTAALIRVTN